MDLAGLSGQEAAQRLAMSFRELATAEQELDRVTRYLEEYRQRPPGPVAVRPGQLENDRAFFAKLSEVVTVQKRKLAATKLRHEAVIADWKKAHRHSNALEKLYDTYCRRELIDMARREGESLDELMQRWISAGD